MILPLIQIALIVAVGLYLGRLRASMRRRNTQSWSSLVARLRPEWSARELGSHSLWQEALNVNAQDAWQRMEGPKGSGRCIRTRRSCWRWPNMPPEIANR